MVMASAGQSHCAQTTGRTTLSPLFIPLQDMLPPPDRAELSGYFGIPDRSTSSEKMSQRNDDAAEYGRKINAFPEGHHLVGNYFDRLSATALLIIYLKIGQRIRNQNIDNG